jgi:hypothetical protein
MDVVWSCADRMIISPCRSRDLAELGESPGPEYVHPYAVKLYDHELLSYLSVGGEGHLRVPSRPRYLNFECDNVVDPSSGPQIVTQFN